MDTFGFNFEDNIQLLLSNDRIDMEDRVCRQIRQKITTVVPCSWAQNTSVCKSMSVAVTKFYIFIFFILHICTYICIYNIELLQ